MRMGRRPLVSRCVLVLGVGGLGFRVVIGIGGCGTLNPCKVQDSGFNGLELKSLALG